MYYSYSIRGTESRTWARVQLKYDGFLFFWTPKQIEKMPQFCPNYNVISKKKVFTKILIRWWFGSAFFHRIWPPARIK